jgi:DUF4097 and DUF4098 domain-containing protein YvlB
MFNARQPEFRTTQELRVEAGGVRRLQASTRSGAVKLRGAAGETIHGRADKQVRANREEAARRFMEQVRVETRREGDTLRIEAVWPERLPREIRSAAVTFEVEVPRRLAVEARSNNGALQASDIARAALTTRNGGVEARRIAGDLEVQTANGAVVAEAVSGDARLQTHNGAIRAARIGGTLMAHTHNGGIDAEFADGARESIELRTNNGGIYAQIPARLSARLTAETRNGRVNVRPEEGVRYNRPRTHADATWGSGAGRVLLETRNGGIEVVQR